MMATQLEVRIAGRWLAFDTLYGVDEFSTVWPGGSDEVTFTLATALTRRLTGGEDVRVYYGGAPVFGGSLLEPDPSADQLTAQGAWREGDKPPALDGSGNATKVPDTAVDQAITRGLRWTRPNSLSGSALADADITQGPLSINQLLDQWALSNNTRWGVDPYRQVYAQADPTFPAFQTLPLAGGLGYDLSNYASTLIGRYKTSTGFATTSQTDTTAEALHGDVEDTVDLTPRGIITATQANNILSNLLTQGRSTPQWTKSIEFVYGEILNMAGSPVDLETVAAGNLLRVNGGWEIVQRGNNHMYVDVMIGRTTLSDGTLTVDPLLLATRTLVDALADMGISAS